MLKALEPILREAGRLMCSFHDPAVYAKGRHADFVTEADLAVQSLLMERLAAAFPGARFFAEEQKGNVLTDDLTFIIDPIDGTTNYFRRRRASAVSVGAVENGRVVLGAILDPYRDEMYTAQKGCGAFMNGRRLQVTDLPLSQSLIGLGSSPYDPALAEVGGRTLAALLPRAADVRRSGSACLDLCDVAAGRSEAYFEWILQPWDYCAAIALITEAGGRCGSILGGEATLHQPCPFLGATARVYDELQQLLQAVWAHRPESV